MFGLSILLTTFLALPLAEEDTIRTERLEEVVVTSNSARQRIQNVQTGAEVLQLEDLTSAPQLFGQTDIMRSIQLLPGVKAESDASSSFQVRGGTSAQNQVLFDLAPVYNSGHLAGLSPLSMKMRWLQPPSIRACCQPSMVVLHQRYSILQARLATSTTGTVARA